MKIAVLIVAAVVAGQYVSKPQAFVSHATGKPIATYTTIGFSGAGRRGKDTNQARRGTVLPSGQLFSASTGRPKVRRDARGVARETLPLRLP